MTKRSKRRKQEIVKITDVVIFSLTRVPVFSGNTFWRYDLGPKEIQLEAFGRGIFGHRHLSLKVPNIEFHLLLGFRH